MSLEAFMEARSKAEWDEGRAPMFRRKCGAVAAGGAGAESAGLSRMRVGASTDSL